MVTTLPHLPRFSSWGGRGGVQNPLSYPTIEELQSSSLREELLKKLRKRPANPISNLSHWFHTGHMEPSKPAKIVLLVLGAFMLVAWALIIWVATVVTQTALETLDYIIRLAQMS